LLFSIYIRTCPGLLRRHADRASDFLFYAAKAKLHTCASVKAMFMHQLHQKFPSGISSRVLRHICLL